MATFAGMLDYLVVGLGLAGISFCERLEEKNKAFKVISDASHTSSIVAGGLYNPVILKRFTLAWKADEQLQLAKEFYQTLEVKLGVRLDYPVPVYRRFNSIEEQNLWFESTDKPKLTRFLSPQIHPNKNFSVDAPLGYGEVLHTGRIDTKKMVEGYRGHMVKKDLLISETFDYNQLAIKEGFLQYNNLRAKRIVFAEGYGMMKNPYFNHLPMKGNKGEYLIIGASELKIDFALKSSVFAIPLGNDIYKVGANYDWKDKTNEPTEKTRFQLAKKWESFVKCDYEIINQLAGVRPTVSDRRPLVGQHPEHKNLFVLNGFGSRGVLIAPYASGQLLSYIEDDIPLDADLDINRFKK
ncbi:glycine/D-amino acid oxidase-like deaminating enzyme [Flavobacteriaceae bacterium MAR_2009_75]|nr:glycine/D-amino acid oxidase-like deaminating enzyme [Flavobacteriaceae bacterium MAR_2009_75]